MNINLGHSRGLKVTFINADSHPRLILVWCIRIFCLFTYSNTPNFNKSSLACYLMHFPTCSIWQLGWKRLCWAQNSSRMLYSAYRTHESSEESKRSLWRNLVEAVIGITTQVSLSVLDIKTLPASTPYAKISFQILWGTLETTSGINDGLVIPVGHVVLNRFPSRHFDECVSAESSQSLHYLIFLSYEHSEISMGSG
jgi:hypothetical protein